MYYLQRGKVSNHLIYLQSWVNIAFYLLDFLLAKKRKKTFISKYFSLTLMTESNKIYKFYQCSHLNFFFTKEWKAKIF